MARDRAADGPTWRIESATSTRHSGCSFAFSSSFISVSVDFSTTDSLTCFQTASRL